MNGPDSPYKGLDPFDDSELDALLFFGRERERDVVIANLMAARLTLLYGPSGVGKSSLLNAGVGRRLREEPEGHELLVIGSWVEDRADELRAAVAAAAGSYLYVILDQFEEFFLYHDAGGPFGTALAELLADRGKQVNVLLSLREDALAQLDAFKGRIANLYANSLRLDHLDRASARAAVLGPLERYEELTGEHVVAEPEFVEAVLDQVATGRLELVEAGRGGLEDTAPDGGIEAPFLQLVLERLWTAERGAGSQRLRLATLDGLGGCEAIVHEHLARALAALGPAEKDLAASVFDHLVTPSGTKIAHRASDLAEYASVGEQELVRVLDTLGRERILREVDGANGGGRRYEIFHDVLADPVLAWRAERRLERERHEAERKHRRLLALAASSLVALAITAGVAVFALTQRSQARSAARRALARELDATALTSLAVDPQEGLVEALRAARLSPGAQAEDVLRTTLLASRLRAVLPAGGPVTSADYSRDGRLILTASVDGKARIYDARSHHLLRALEAHSPLAGAAFSGSDRLVVTDGHDGAARVWVTATGHELRALMHRRSVLSASFSRSGGLLVTASADRAARIWRVGSWKELAVLRHPGPVRGAVFNRDGSLVLTRSSDRYGRLFDARRHRLLRRFDQGGTVTVAAFSPNGRYALTAGANRTARIWSVRDGRLLRELKGHVGRVLTAVFSPRGNLVATGSSDGSGRVWSLPAGDLVTVLLGHANYVVGAAFSPDGFSLVTTSVDRTARVWQPGTGDLRAVLAGDTESVTGTAFSPDGSAVVTASEDGTARVWDPQIQPTLHLLLRGDEPVQSTAFTPDGKGVLVVVEGTAGASIRDASSGRLVAQVPVGATLADGALSSDGRRLAVASGRSVIVRDVALHREVLRLRAQFPLVHVAFARDGRIAAGDTNGGASIWSAEGRLDRTLRVRGARTTSVAFSPDGDRLVTASADRLARVWDARSGRLLATLHGHRDALTSARFSPDGAEIVTASVDHDARLWDAVSGRLLRVLRGHFAVVSDAEFSPDGRWIVTAGPTTAGLWDVHTGQLVFFLRGHEARLTSAAFDPTSRNIVTASIDGSVRTYRCDVCGGLDDLVRLATKRQRESG